MHRPTSLSGPTELVRLGHRSTRACWTLVHMRPNADSPRHLCWLGRRLRSATTGTTMRRSSGSSERGSSTSSRHRRCGRQTRSGERASVPTTFTSEQRNPQRVNPRREEGKPDEADARAPSVVTSQDVRLPVRRGARRHRVVLPPVLSVFPIASFERAIRRES